MHWVHTAIWLLGVGLMMPNADERVITLSVAKWNVVLSALGLAASIAGEIAAQAAEQERGMALANRPTVEADGLDQPSP